MDLRDEFGHTAWMHAMSRAMEESGFAATGLPALYDALAPAVLDVQTDGRLVRIERHQGEYWVLTLMLRMTKSCSIPTRALQRVRHKPLANSATANGSSEPARP